MCQGGAQTETCFYFYQKNALLSNRETRLCPGRCLPRQDPLSQGFQRSPPTEKKPQMSKVCHMPFLQISNDLGATILGFAESKMA